MGFTNAERIGMTELFREYSEKLVQVTLPDEILSYLTTQGLLNRVRDYGKFPSKFRFKPGKNENIVLTFFMDSTFKIHEKLKELKYVVSPKFNIKIDCAFLMVDNDGDLKYVWPQRNLAINSVQEIINDDDFDDLIDEMREMTNVDILHNVCEIHQNQSCFEKSGYRPIGLLTTAFYLAKNSLVPE